MYHLKRPSDHSSGLENATLFCCQRLVPSHPGCSKIRIFIYLQDWLCAQTNAINWKWTIHILIALIIEQKKEYLYDFFLFYCKVWVLFSPLNLSVEHKNSQPFIALNNLVIQFWENGAVVIKSKTWAREQKKQRQWSKTKPVLATRLKGLVTCLN